MVVAAHHLQLRTRVALKFMHPAASVDGVAIARFLREARAAAAIKSEHVVRVSDIGTLENGAPYLVMEYLEGRDLARELEERGRLPIPEAIDIVLQACDALAEAHALGVVHRDLKPANLFLCRRANGVRTLKLLDFGISKLMGAVDEPSVTKSHSMLGTPLYMSPEQLRSAREVDARTDVWALGAVLYQLVTGEPPFPGELLADLCVKIATEQPRPLRDLLPGAPPQLNAVIGRCLEKERARRYPNIAAFALDLVAFGSHTDRFSVERLVSSIKAYPAPVVVSAHDPQDTISRPKISAPTLTSDTAAAWVRPPRLSLLPSRSALMALVAVTVLAIGSAWTLLRSHRSAATSVGSPEASAARPEVTAEPRENAPTTTHQAPFAPAESLTVTPGPAPTASAGAPSKTLGRVHPPASSTVKSSPALTGPQSLRPAPATSEHAPPRLIAPAVSAVPRNVFDTRKL